MSDDRKPLLVFPEPSESSKARLWGGSSDIHTPSHDRQVQRIGPKFEHLREMLRRRESELKTSPEDANPEQVLVFELAGTMQEFINAVRRVDGLEWLLEGFRDDIEPNEHFYRETDESSSLYGMVYFIGTNQRGMDELISLWNKYKENPDVELDWGLNRWKNVFENLKEVRKWDYLDRFRETGVIQDWKFRLEHSDRPVRFEAEFWYRDSHDDRQKAYRKFQEDIENGEGEVISEFTLDSIRYHGVLAELPPKKIRSVISAFEDDQRPEVRAVHCEGVMSFRPAGQIVSRPSRSQQDIGELFDEQESLDSPPDTSEPVAALLDGLPLAKHDLLQGRIIIDDPDGWEELYPADQRRHGTAMASLIIHGDLSGEKVGIDTPLYVRPILKPDPDHSEAESLPDDRLTLDLIHGAVRRIFEGDDNTDPVAPNVKVINFSIGDPAQPAHGFPSALARLLDWLSHKYNVLFNVSVGNHTHDIEVTVPPDESPQSISEADLQAETLKSMYENTRRRRLISPAESVNALTVGAAHDDESGRVNFGRNRSLILSENLPSPINALGLGFNRGVKPEILLPGGRAVYSPLVTPDNGTATFRLTDFRTRPPGQKVASPGSSAGVTNATSYTFGTSNATSLASRRAIQLLDVVDSIRNQERGDHITDEHIAVLLKALLTHGANWSEVSDTVTSIVGGGQKARENAARLVGYGSIDFRRSTSCTDQRATIVACGEIGTGEAKKYAFPLPPSLSAERVSRKMTITLAWLTPTNCTHSKYRRAHLWFDPPTDKLKLSRKEADWQAARRGTLQHEVIEGKEAVPLTPEEDLQIDVNCRADAGKLQQDVRYALLASLEVAPETNLPIYEEVRNAVQTQVELRSVSR